MKRSAPLALALCAALALAGPTPAPGADPTPVATSAAKKKKPKTRAQKLSACLRKADRRSGAAKRRARATCRRKYGPKKKTVLPPAPVPGPAPAPGPVPTPTPTPAAPSVDPVRDDAKFREALKSSYFHRQYAVPKPNHGAGYNYHGENYEFCESLMGHFYEGIAYIYRSRGPWTVVEGNINGDGTKGNGTIRFTQAEANHAEEVGKVQTITLQWEGDQAQISHPEIGVNAFARHVKPAPCTQ